MMKPLLILLAIVSHHSVFSQLPQAIPLAKDGKLIIEVNKNVELLGFAYFIGFEGAGIENKTIEIDGKQISKKDWHNYGFRFYEKYRSYAKSESLAQSLSVADHLWLDYIIGLLLQVDDFPHAKLPININERYFVNFSKGKNLSEAKQNAVLFLDGLNNFYKEVNFDHYLFESRAYYAAALEQVKVNLPDDPFVSATERFYKNRFDRYTLIPSLTIPKGMGFGLKYGSKNNMKVFNVFGALDYQFFQQADKLDMGFGNPEKLRELSIHEFGHSFANPEVDKIPPDNISATEKLFEPIKSAMAAQGYNTWKVCLYEHFVRAGEILIARNLGKYEDATKLNATYINIRKFIYLPSIIEELNSYEKAQTDTYQEAVKRAMIRLSNLSSPDSVRLADRSLSSDPREAQFHTEDIANFWKVFDKTYPQFSSEPWQEEYINKGSIGLKGFLKNRIENGKLLSETIRESLGYYESIRQSSLSIDRQKERFYECFESLKKIYPAAAFPDVYFVIGRNNAGGTTFDKGLIIGAEKFGEQQGDFKPAIRIEYVDEVVTHELIHFQQNYPQDHSLLAQCVKEGSADFLCELIAGEHSNKAMHKFAEEHRTDLWQAFMAKKDGNDWTDWLYYQKDKSRPKDVGYWIGYKITKSYYDKMDDKLKAVKDILTIKDFKDFLIKSGYHGE